MVFVPKLADAYRWKRDGDSGLYSAFLKSPGDVDWKKVGFWTETDPRAHVRRSYDYEIQLRMVRTFFFGDTIIGSVEL